jgi:hypothetical protein
LVTELKSARYVVLFDGPFILLKSPHSGLANSIQKCCVDFISSHAKLLLQCVWNLNMSISGPTGMKRHLNRESTRGISQGYLKIPYIPHRKEEGSYTYSQIESLSWTLPWSLACYLVLQIRSSPFNICFWSKPIDFPSKTGAM